MLEYSQQARHAKGKEKAKREEEVDPLQPGEGELVLV